MMESSEHSIAAAPRPAPEGPIHPSSGRRRIDWRRIFAPFGAILLFLAKLGAKLKALLLLLPKVKLFTTAGSMLVSVARLLADLGMEVRARLRAPAPRARARARVPAAARGRQGLRADVHPVPRRRHLGPLVRRKRARGGARRARRADPRKPRRGGGRRASRSRPTTTCFRALAFTGFFLNLFNLLPVVPLDGGRAMAALSPWMWIAGFAALVALDVRLPEPDHVADPRCSAAMETWRRWQERKSPEAQELLPRRRRSTACCRRRLLRRSSRCSCSA